LSQTTAKSKLRKRIKMFYPLHIFKKWQSEKSSANLGRIAGPPETDFVCLKKRRSGFLVFLAIILTTISGNLAGPVFAQTPIDRGVITNGDINNDGNFDVFDLIRLEKAVVLNLKLNEDEIRVSDVDGDGELTNYDYLVIHNALDNVKQGMGMFDAIKTAIEKDLGKSGDNVEIYLDLARFYRKENLNSRSIGVLESILEAMDTRHPLYGTVSKALDTIKSEELDRLNAQEDILNQDLYKASEDPTGKISLRRKVVQMQSRLSNLLKEKDFATQYNNKMVRSKLNSVMENMLGKISQDQLVDVSEVDNFNQDVRGVMEDPENLYKDLGDEQKNKIKSIVDESTSSIRNDLVKLNQQFAKGEGGPVGTVANDRSLGKTTILDRRETSLQNRTQGNLQSDRLIIANKPRIKPDTASIVAPQYTLEWDVSNVLGARDAALEISKSGLKFTNPRGTAPDEGNTLYYTPSLGTIKGVRKGSAHELEGVGTYQYRVAALNAKGELMSRFSDAVELVVVRNNVNIIAKKPQVSPKKVSLESPNYTFRWDLTNMEGANDVAVEVSKPNTHFSNPNGRDLDRINTFFYNPSLGGLVGQEGSSIEGLAGPGKYYFRIIAISPYSEFIGQWSDPDTLFVTAFDTDKSGEQIPPSVDSIVPESPIIDSAAQDLVFAWDVSPINGASGISMEVSESPAESAGREIKGDSSSVEIVFSQIFEGATGNSKIDTSQLKGPGDYDVRIAAVDSTENFLSVWSKPAHFKVKSPQAETTPPQPQPQTEPAPVVPDSSKSLEKAQPEQVKLEPEPAAQPPQGDQLEVISNNTPLYENNNLSSTELVSLKKGEILIRVSTSGLWYKVYYPGTKSNGWVLTFNVKNAE